MNNLNLYQAWNAYRGLLFRGGFGIYPHPARPKSRGKISLRSNNILDHPIIIGNYFKDPEDVKVTIEGIVNCITKKLVQIESTKTYF